MKLKIKPLELGARIALVAVPVAVLAGAVIFETVSLLKSENLRWLTMTEWLMLVGLVASVVSVPVALMDWMSFEEGSQMKKIAGIHTVGKVLTSGAFLLSWAMRVDSPFLPSTASHILAYVGFVLAVITARYGGIIVYRQARIYPPPIELTGEGEAHSERYPQAA